MSFQRTYLKDLQKELSDDSRMGEIFMSIWELRLSLILSYFHHRDILSITICDYLQSVMLLRLILNNFKEDLCKLFGCQAILSATVHFRATLSGTI